MGIATQQTWLYSPKPSVDPTIAFYPWDFSGDVSIRAHTVKYPGLSHTIQWETLMNPHFNSFDEINFDKLLDIAKCIQLIWGILIG